MMISGSATPTHVSCDLRSKYFHGFGVFASAYEGFARKHRKGAGTNAKLVLSHPFASAAPASVSSFATSFSNVGAPIATVALALAANTATSHPSSALQLVGEEIDI